MFARSLRFAVVLLAVAFAAACAAKRAPAADAPRVPVRVATYNIRVGIGADGKWSGTDPSENLRAIAKYLTDERLDIVLLQEVDRFQKRTAGVDEVAMLAEATGMNSAYAPAMVDGEAQYGIAILSRWPIASFDAVALPRIDYTQTQKELPTWFSEQRMALVARIDSPHGPVSAICTHLGLTKEQRLQQIEALARIAQAEARSGRAVVLGGDFNAEPDGLELAAVRAVLADAYHDHPRNNGLVEDMTVRSRNTFPSTGPDRCIDYIFFDPAAFSVASIAVGEARLSDHLPVVAELSMAARK